VLHYRDVLEEENQNRDHYGILSLCRESQAKTRLLQKTNLSWQLGNRHLDNMLSLGLLEIHHSPIKYAITQKGNMLLDRWKAVSETIQALNHFDFFTHAFPRNFDDMRGETSE
jgi:predicted transcriptional regulator